MDTSGVQCPRYRRPERRGQFHGQGATMTTTERMRRFSGRRELEELIQTCISIENRRFNPFLLDIAEALSIIRRHSNQLGTLEDHLLDMRAITSVARFVGLQSANLRCQSSSLFIDPSMVKQKLEIGRAHV